ncbi:aminoglycoside phosphotransferase family protein [Mycoplasmatota bacterium]|nr:aminoglycoside phosphotransferase family protein [Mycoplasmatota bacterium]
MKFSNEMIKPVIGKMYKEEVEILSFNINENKDGTLGEIYLISGECKTSAEKLNYDIALKIQKKWSRFGDPESWLREKNIYESELVQEIGELLPKAILIEEKDDKIWIWMEKAEGNHDRNLSVRDYGRIASEIGRLHGKFIDNLPTYSWLSDKYWIVKTINIWSGDAVNWLKDNEILSKECTSNLLDAWENREEHIDFLLSMAKTLCHRDLTPGNVFVGDKVSIIDWDSAGIGIIGEDIADLFAEALVYYDFDIYKAFDLEQTLITNYYKSLRDYGIKLEDIKKVFKLYLLLNWSYRIICISTRSDEATTKRYVKILEYISSRND